MLFPHQNVSIADLVYHQTTQHKTETGDLCSRSRGDSNHKDIDCEEGGFWEMQLFCSNYTTLRIQNLHGILYRCGPITRLTYRVSLDISLPQRLNSEHYTTDLINSSGFLCNLHCQWPWGQILKIFESPLYKTISGGQYNLAAASKTFIWWQMPDCYLIFLNFDSLSEISLSPIYISVGRFLGCVAESAFYISCKVQPMVWVMGCSAPQGTTLTLWFVGFRSFPTYCFLDFW